MLARSIADHSVDHTGSGRLLSPLCSGDSSCALPAGHTIAAPSPVLRSPRKSRTAVVDSHCQLPESWGNRRAAHAVAARVRRSSNAQRTFGAGFGADLRWRWGRRLRGHFFDERSRSGGASGDSYYATRARGGARRKRARAGAWSQRLPYTHSMTLL